MGLLDRISQARGGEERQSSAPLSIYDWAKMFRPGGQVNYGGTTYQAYQVDYKGESPAAGWYDGNSVVFACELNRLLLFSEARFQYQRLQGGRPGDLFGTQALGVLEEPWIGATTRDLLARMELDVTCYGNSYWVNDGPYLHRLDPGRVTVLTEQAQDMVLTGNRIGERLLAYAYKDADDNTTVYLPGEICHYKPIPDRTNPWIGMSWLNPCLPDVDADVQLTEHKRSHLRNGAAVPFVISYPLEATDEQFWEAVEGYKAAHEGAMNSGKVLHLGAGADVKTIGQTFEQLAFKATQGHGETRIAACAGVPPIIVGLSEGLASATYSNYGQARRRFADGTLRPLWGAAAGALSSVVPIEDAARLWYDDRDIPFLREDVKDQAEIFAKDASSLRQLVDAGFEPDAAIEGLAARDLSRLAGEHTGLYSVQLQPPGTQNTTTDDVPDTQEGP